jgi:hypothetical protein
MISHTHNTHITGTRRIPKCRGKRTVQSTDSAECTIIICERYTNLLLFTLGIDVLTQDLYSIYTYEL